jgi:hypothetical protein
MKTQTLRLLAVALLMGARYQWAAGETFQSLAARLPRTANALVLIYVEQTLASALAREQGWARKLEVAYVERPVILPPEAIKLVMGASLQSDEGFRAAWEIAVMELDEPVPIRAIARGEAGYADTISGLSTAITPRNLAFVDMGDNVLAAVRPADRQFLSRWISSTRPAPRLDLSEYLKSALPLVNDRAQTLLAVDMTDVLSPHDVEAKLAKAAWMSSKQSDVGEIAQIVSTLRGVALRVAVGKQCQGRLQIDFDADVAPLAEVARPLVLDALDNLGFRTDELAAWDFKLVDKSIHMQGVLSTDAQRRVFSVIELPAAKTKEETAPKSGSSPTGDNEVRDRSQAYFKSTQVMLDDLRKGLKDTKATSAWMERYARRIDELPVLNVDELLIDYGDKLAETLRIMAVSKRQAGIRYGVRATEDRGYYGGYSYGEDAYTRTADRSQARKEEMAVSADTRVEGWRLIDDATADIRRTLTKKYSAEF